MTMESESFEHLILNLNFKKAISLAEQMDFETFQIKMVNFATTEDSNILWYPFLLEYMLYNESAELHNTAFYILSLPFCRFENATLSALYHARKALELSNGSKTEFLVPFLILNTGPEKVVSDEEAKKIAKKIIELDPKHQYANAFLKDLTS
ncbi:hypothetical protein AAGG74_08995 [Bacillus mexicanus]|uniref:hypothetical protein n=1 Tax=Bacillus TaxID=1386 RepID=UPI001D07F671|nr:hypothetical protein [Bacillus subtilis]MCB7161216.1 hypothetical protein [Bacillus subtilis]MCB7457786.1 hypothetical protein [Bacillus subtilis]